MENPKEGGALPEAELLGERLPTANIIILKEGFNESH
jgi:hypothetical protein